MLWSAYLSISVFILNAVRACSAKVLPSAVVGHAPLSVKYLDTTFWHGVDQQTKKWNIAQFSFRSRDMISATIPKNRQATATCLKQRGGGGGLSACLHMQFKSGVKTTDRNSINRAGHLENATCLRHYFSCVSEPPIGHISSWVTTCAVKLI